MILSYGQIQTVVHGFQNAHADNRGSTAMLCKLSTEFLHILMSVIMVAHRFLQSNQNNSIFNGTLPQYKFDHSMCYSISCSTW